MFSLLVTIAGDPPLYSGVLAAGIVPGSAVLHFEVELLALQKGVPPGFLFVWLVESPADLFQALDVNKDNVVPLDEVRSLINPQSNQLGLLPFGRWIRMGLGIRVGGDSASYGIHMQSDTTRQEILRAADHAESLHTVRYCEEHFLLTIAINAMVIFEGIHFARVNGNPPCLSY